MEPANQARVIMLKNSKGSLFSLKGPPERANWKRTIQDMEGYLGGDRCFETRLIRRIGDGEKHKFGNETGYQELA